MAGSSDNRGGRLEVMLDRSWEVQSITWSNLTWWDPLPCGQELLSTIKTSDPLPLPSPALSLLGHPPTPHRKLPPTHLSFRSMSTSPSPIPPRTNPRYSIGEHHSYSSSPLAWPLPPSPDSYNSVFLHSDSSSPSYPFPYTPSSISPQYICSSPYNYQPNAPQLPTPPDSEGRPSSYPTQSSYKPSRNMFHFSRQPPPPPSLPPLATFTPPSQNDSLLGIPPYLAHIPPPSYY